VKLPAIPLIFSFVLILSAFSVILYAPSSSPLSPWNTGSLGMSELVQRTGASIDRNLTGIQCGSAVVMVLERPMSQEEMNAVERMLSCGSTVVLGDSEGYSKELLSSLGIPAELSGPVLDEVSGLGSRWVIRTETTGSLRITVAVPNATAIASGKAPDALEAYTSSYAYIDENGNGFYDVGEPMGRFLILAGWKVGGGELILIPSELFFSNEYVGLEGNLELLENLSSSRGLHIYTGALQLGALDAVKEEVYSWSRGRPLLVTYLAALGASSALSFVWASSSLEMRRRAERREKILLSVLSALVSVPCAAYAYSSGNFLFALPIPVLLAILIAAPHASLPFAASVSLASSGLSPYFSPIFIASAAVAGRYAAFREGRSFLGPSSLSSLELIGLSSLSAFIFPQVVPALLSASIAVIGVAAFQYAFSLRSAEVQLLNGGNDVYAGSRVAVGFLVRARSSIVLIAESWRGRVVKKAEPESVVVLSEVAEHMGVNRVSVELSASDPSGFAFRSLGALTIEFNALPMTSRLLERAGEALGRMGSGSVPQELSMSVLMRLEEAGRAYAIPQEEFEELARSLLGSGISGLIGRMIAEYASSQQMRRRSYGEYAGVKVYEPGDPLKAIHWKKSLSKQMLISKDYTSSGEDSGAGKAGGSSGGGVLIANLDASNPGELDAILASILHYVLDTASKSPEGEVDLMILSGSYAVALRGRAREMLKLLYDALKENPAEARYSYESINRRMRFGELAQLLASNGKTFRAVRTSLELSSRSLVDAMIKSGYRPPMAFTLLHSKAMSTWASYAVQALSLLGYSYRSFAEVAGNG